MYQRPTVVERVSTEQGEIQLQKREHDFEIIFNGTFLMATYNGDSEKLLVRCAIEAVASPKRMLIGGLGVGFSLGEALNHEMLEKITVVEIAEKIIEWNQTHLAKYSNGALDHPKVEVINADFIAWIRNCHTTYDVICLDIDNGPDWVVFEENNQLYSESGINSLLKVLSKSGAISFWSASKNDDFATWLHNWFNEVIINEVPHQRGEPDYIYLGCNAKN